MDYSKLEKKHNIFGHLMSYLDLKRFKVIETFENTNHDTRALLQDNSGTFYLYDFHEEMGFPDDEIIEHYFILDSEEQGKQYAQKSIIELKSIFQKFIWVGPNYNIKTIG